MWCPILNGWDVPSSPVVKTPCSQCRGLRFGFLIKERSHVLPSAAKKRKTHSKWVPCISATQGGTKQFKDFLRTWDISGGCCLVSSHIQLFCDPMDCSQPCSSLHRISQARILELVAISSSRGSSQPKDWTRVSCTGRFWATEPPGQPGTPVTPVQSIFLYSDMPLPYIT